MERQFQARAGEVTEFWSGEPISDPDLVQRMIEWDSSFGRPLRRREGRRTCARGLGHLPPRGCRTRIRQAELKGIRTRGR